MVRLLGLPPVGPDGLSPQVPAERIFEAAGSSNNRQDLVPLASQLNGAKGRIFKLKAPIATTRFHILVREAARTGTDADARTMLQHIRVPLGIFEFLNDPAAGQQPFNRARALVRQEFELIEREMPDATNFATFADEVIEDYLQSVENRVQSWLIEQIRYAEHIFGTTRDANGHHPNSYLAVLAALSSYRSKIQNMRLPRGNNGGGT